MRVTIDYYEGPELKSQRAWFEIPTASIVRAVEAAVRESEVEKIAKLDAGVQITVTP